MNIYTDQELFSDILNWCQNNPLNISDLNHAKIPAWNKGEKGQYFHTKESKQKISQASKGRMVGENEKRLKRIRFLGENNPMYGKKLNDDHKSKLHHKCKLPKTLEHKQKISNSSLNRERVICPHCQKTTAINMASRWHFDNCKSNKPTRN